MSERIQKVLDGELPRDALSPVERAELEAYEEAMDQSLAPVRASAAPDMSGTVMRRVRSLPRHGRDPVWRRLLSWLWSPRPVQVRPAWALAGTAAVAAALLMAGLVGGPAGPASETTDAPAIAGMPTEGEDAPVFIHFRLDASDAESVQLAADFTGWEPRYTLSQTLPGVWTVVVPVTTGVHQYAFVVDGERWVPDPLAPRVEDGFGGTNSRLDVVRPEPARSL